MSLHPVAQSTPLTSAWPCLMGVPLALSITVLVSLGGHSFIGFSVPR